MLFKEGLALVVENKVDDLREEYHDEAVKLADLFAYYHSLTEGYLRELTSQPKETAAFIEAVNEHVNRQLDFLQKIHLVKTSLHKDGWQVIKGRLLLEAK